MNKNGMLRKDKKYPEAFEYLGWCSWDAFHQEVSEDKLVEKAQEFKDKEIPVRWIILDDMWGDVPCVCRENMGWRDLNDWEADPKRFPNGLKGAVKRIKENYGLKVGIWHPINGYWLGIDPNGTLAKKHGDLLEYTIPIDGNTDIHCNYMHSFDKEKIEKYYDLQHAFYKDCGIDFTKIDNQGSMERFSHRKMPVSKAAKNLPTAIENAAAKYYDGSLINCMGMTIENFWNRSYSTVNRVSDDFLPEDRKWFICHILQCSYNCLTQGTAYTGDWDMWWSDDDQAKKNAVLRSMSGGPIYMSDELNRSIKEVIMPTVLSDGRILRLKNPALPTADCMFADCEHDSVAFKLFNTIGNCGVLATFNLDENENEVSCTAASKDINGLADGDYVVYNWFEKTAQLLKKGEKLEYTLKNYDDFRLLLFVPVINGKAVIGLMEKYMAPAAVTVSGDDVCSLDDGTLVVYSQNALEGWDKLEGDLYIKKVKKNEKIKV